MNCLLFTLQIYTCRNLLKNPPPNPQDLEMLKKATTDGIKLPGSEVVTTLPASLVEEAIIVSELFKVRLPQIYPNPVLHQKQTKTFQLNELSSVLLLLQGEEQLPRYPGLTRGLVAVLLYYDGRCDLGNEFVKMSMLCANYRFNTINLD